jgi:hypothetical protein
MTVYDYVHGNRWQAATSADTKNLNVQLLQQFAGV